MPRATLGYRLLEIIRARGTVDSAQLTELSGVRPNNQVNVLSRCPEAGQVEIYMAKAPGRSARHPLRHYRWIGKSTPASGATPATPATPEPQAAGMRRCLGADCGRLFKSAHAGNRLCPACRGRAAGSATPFDIPATVRYR